MTRRAPGPQPIAVSVEDAQQRILARFSALPAVDLDLAAAHGKVLARDVAAPHDLPPFANSAMDGYALRAADTHGADGHSIELQVIGSVQAGDASQPSIGPGQAARIMTGAALPPGADAVVRLEDVAIGPGSVIVSHAVRARSHVRERGEDFCAGAPVLHAGMRLLAPEIGALAALGVAQASVHRRPRIGLLSTGDEVVPPGEPLRAGQIYDCNAYLLAALVRELDAEPVMLGIAGDSLAALRDRLTACPDLDLLVTSGGVSVGDFDLVGDALGELGAVELWQLRIKPGKPLAFGDVLGVPMLGLPGNPVAALVAFMQLGRPAIMRMSGRADLVVPELEARLTTRIENRGDRTLYARGVLERAAGGWQVTPVRAQGSAQLSGLLHGNALIVVRGEVAEAGSTVPVQVLEPGTLLSRQG